MNRNLLLLTDSYKFSHYRQYPVGTEEVYSYFESRGGLFKEVVFFGLQYFLKEYLQGVVVTKEKIDEAENLVNQHIGPGLFNRDGWEYILREHGGKLPVRISAVKEGSVIPVLNALMTIENTDPACYWLTNYLETLLVQVWYPTTVATQSREIKKVIAKYLTETGGIEGLNFKLHDFGFRGVSSVESAALGGAAHLVNFLGTDTVAALILAQQYYNSGVCAYSIPAAEHSTITSWGRENEADAMKNMLVQFKDSPLVACVSDSFNIYEACEKLWGEKLKEDVLNFKGTLVIRPDSGNPVEVVNKVLDILGEKFGYETNVEGYKFLNPKVRVIQGDGVDYESIKAILQRMKENGWSAGNIAFGMGGALLQKLNRDTQKFAFKCSSVTVNREEREVYKDPITDPGKVSKMGKLNVVRIGNVGEITTLPSGVSQETDLLETVFEDGEIVRNQDFNEIRELAKL